ncbi:hypothetical protein HZC07_04335 [Candidatus Micrarchaeota archaeon]|nr:hypothetical protein [Candidatus Micrarchaeota archaeon]
MERKISTNLYLIAFVISVVIFIAGISIGKLIDSSTITSLSSQLDKTSQRLASIQLLLFTQGNSSSFCPVYSSELGGIDKDVDDAGYKISYLEDIKGTYDPELKKQYFTLEANSYVLSKKFKELCGDRSVLLINFYSNKDCSNCKSQGSEILNVRDNLRSQNVSVKLFSFDGDLGSPIADAFKKQYSVTSYPSVVINERTYAGYQNSNKLTSLILSATKLDRPVTVTVNTTSNTTVNSSVNTIVNSTKTS